VKTLRARNAKEAVVAPMVVPGEICFLAGVWSQAVSFVLVCWKECGFRRLEDVFTFTLRYTGSL
jgi:hypothetical protein